MLISLKVFHYLSAAHVHINTHWTHGGVKLCAWCSQQYGIRKEEIYKFSLTTYILPVAQWQVTTCLSLNKAIIKYHNINPAINSLYITSLCMYQNGMYKLKKIASTDAEVQCTIWFARFTPIATTEHNFQYMYGSVLPSALLTCQGFIQLIEKGNKLKQEPAGQKQTSEEDAELVGVPCLWGSSLQSAATHYTPHHYTKCASSMAWTQTYINLLPIGSGYFQAKPFPV